MNKTRDALAPQVFVLAGAGASAQVLYAVLVAMVARRVGPADFGLAAGALGAGGFLAGVLDFGFSAYSIREMARGQMTRSTYWNRFRGLFVVTLAVATLAVVIGLATAHVAVGVVIGLVVVTRVLVAGVTVPHRADRRVFRVACVVLVERVTALAAFCVISTGDPARPLVAFWCSLGVGAVAASIVGFLLSGDRRESLRMTASIRPWSGVAGYGYFSLAIGAISLDVVVLGAAGGSVQAGIYGVVARWTQPVQLLAQTFSAAASPVIAGAVSTRSALAMVRRSLWVLCLGLAACLAIIIVSVSPVLPGVIGAQYLESGPVLAVLAVGAAVVLVNQPLASFLQARGYDRFVGRSTALTVLLHLVSVWPAAGSAGAVGAAISYGAAQVVLMSILAVGAWALLRRRGRAQLPARYRSVTVRP